MTDDFDYGVAAGPEDDFAEPHERDPNDGRYAVYLTNPDDQQDAGPSSFTSGRYGFCISAGGIESAVDAVVARAKADGFYGHDWMAKIVPLARQTQAGDRSAGIRLRDGPQPRYVHTEHKVEVLWWPPLPEFPSDGAIRRAGV